MEFSEFEVLLEKTCREQGTLSYFGPNLENIDYQEIKNELAIQDHLINFIQVPINESTITYAEVCLNSSNLFRTKLRYYLFLIKNLDKRKKYEWAKQFTDFFFEHIDELSQIETDDTVLLTQCFNTLLETCVQMSLRVDDIWYYLNQYLARNPNCVYYHAIQSLSLLTTEEKKQNIRDITEQQLSLDAEKGNYLPIENLMEESSKFKSFFIEKVLLQRKLAEAYINRAKHAENSPIIGITFSQKAASIYKQLGDKELENSCLADMGKFLEMESPDWHESVIEFSPQENSSINENIQIIQEIFADSSIPINQRISFLAKYINESSKTIYTPVALTNSIEDVQRSFDSSVFLQLGSVMTLDQDKVISNGNNSLIKAKELAYSLHIETAILPAISTLETSQADFIEKLIESISNCPLITQDEMNFITSAFEDYESGRWIPFICVITPSFESILRKMYNTLEGTHIQAKGTDSLIHSAVNLTQILNNKKVREVLSEDIASYLEYLLNSETSAENIRNNVAHRLTPSSFYSQGRSRLLLHALILVSERIKSKFHVETSASRP